MKTPLLFLLISIYLLTNIEAQICISGNITLTTQADVDNFVATHASTCNEVTGLLKLQGIGITDISGLSFLKKVGSLDIRGSSITTIGSFPDLSDCGDITIRNNYYFVDKINFKNLTSIGELYVWDTLMNVIEFPNLVDADDIFLYSRSLDTIKFPSLVDFSGDNGFGRVVIQNNASNFPGTLVIKDSNAEIVDFSSLTTIHGTFHVQNSQLKNMNGFSNLKWIEYSFNFINNLNFVELTMSDLEMGDKILIDYNLNMTTLNLPKIQIIGNIEITRNNKLREVNFPALFSIWGLEIRNNIKLEACCFVQKIPHMNSLIVRNNRTGCNSILELLDYCVDIENDGIPISTDNCPNTYNPTQADQDGDGIGDPCDNCPTIANNNQSDTNNDGIGNVCQQIAGQNTGLVGIGTSQPKSKLEVVDGDVYIPNLHRGIILKGDDGDCYRISVGEAGALKTVLVACP